MNVVVPAVLAGNAVVIKHSHRSPLCGEHFADAFAASGAPPGLVQALHCDHDTAARIIADPRIGYLAFTGSVDGGHKVYAAAAARRFAAEGARVAGLDLSTPGWWSEVDEVAPAASFAVVDVTDEGAVSAAVDAVVTEHGSIDVVVNCAGVAGGGPVHWVELAEFERVIRVNLTGTFLVCKHALRHMVEQKSGSIVNVASIEGIEGTEGGSAYNACVAHTTS